MNHKILIIEDEKDMAQLMSWRLAQSKFESRLANDGLEGLKAIQEEEPDLILTDIVMPRMDGYTLCRRLQENGILSRIPVIVLTAFGQRAQDFKDMQIREFLIKPFDGQMLVEVIQRVLGEKPKEFQNLGCDAKGEIIAYDEEFIEKVLRTHPDVLVLDASRPGIPAEQMIRSLHSYVLLKDMVILFYLKNKKEKDKKTKWGVSGQEKENTTLRS